MDPILQDMELSSGRHIDAYAVVIMSEYKVIYLIFNGIHLGKFVQRLSLSSKFIFLVMRKPVVLRPVVAEAEGYPRMKHAEEELEDARVEDRTEEAIAHGNRSESVAVSEAEALAFNLNNVRLLKLDHSELFEIRICPYIVVSLEEIHLHSLIHQILEGGKHSDIALRHNITILVPEVPDISEEIEGCRIFSGDST